jgi:hypothetical protein
VAGRRHRLKTGRRAEGNSSVLPLRSRPGRKSGGAVLGLLSMMDRGSHGGYFENLSREGIGTASA